MMGSDSSQSIQCVYMCGTYIFFLSCALVCTTIAVVSHSQSNDLRCHHGGTYLRRDVLGAGVGVVVAGVVGVVVDCMV